MLSEKSNKFLIVLCGPTAVGKTCSAIQLAKQLDTEILSADSRQFFKEMNIGTAKPTRDELASAQHHFINSLSIKDEYNVGMYERDALHVLDSIFRKKDIAVMAGGSGLYINAVCNGFDDVPQANKELRNQLTEMHKKEGIQYLQNTLKKLDEQYYTKVDLKNPHRLIRAIEVCMVSGKPYSKLRKGNKIKRNFIPIKIGLAMHRDKLYERINSRVDAMMAQGLLEEVRALTLFRVQGILPNALQTVGYKELFNHLAGETDLAKAVELIKQNTRNFAKRQMTWFRKDNEIKWFEPHDVGNILKYIKNKAK